MGTKKRALILGITGQDGSYLAELLLHKGYEVHGLQRRTSTPNTKNIEHILGKITLHKGDLIDPISLRRAIGAVQPHELYNEADQDNIGWSFHTVGYNMQVTAAAVASILEIVRDCASATRFFQPISATILDPTVYPQNELTPLLPNSPYACAKAAAYHLVQHYRHCYGLFISTAILFNHCSERRTEDYLLPKICKSAIRIANGEQKQLALGNLDSVVDIGYAPEYMNAAWKILQRDTPDDFVIGTGIGSTIETLVREAFRNREINLDSRDKVVVDPRFYSPHPPHYVADIAKAKTKLGWLPRYNAVDLVHRLIYYYSDSKTSDAVEHLVEEQ